MKNDKEKTIILQNQSHLVQKWFESKSIRPELFDIAMCSDIMAEFIINGMTKEIINRFKTMEEYLDKKYKKS